jgi:hypothetical protein
MIGRGWSSSDHGEGGVATGGRNNCARMMGEVSEPRALPCGIPATARGVGPGAGGDGRSESMDHNAVCCAGDSPRQDRDPMPRSVANLCEQHQANPQFSHGDRIFGRKGGHRIPAHDWSWNPAGSTSESCVPRQDSAEQGPAAGPWVLNSAVPRASDLPGEPGPVGMNTTRNTRFLSSTGRERRPPAPNWSREWWCATSSTYVQTKGGSVRTRPFLGVLPGSAGSHRETPSPEVLNGNMEPRKRVEFTEGVRGRG